MPRASATRATWRSAVATEMSGSRPEPDAVTASAGIAPEPFRASKAALRSSIAAMRSSFSGPQFDPLEAAVRAIVGQQVSVAAARTVAARLVTSYGERLAAPVGSLTHAFPSAAALAEADQLPMPRANAMPPPSARSTASAL